MIERARGKGVYDRLATAELSEFLAAEAGAQYHLVLAADVFVYCSDLAPIAAAVAARAWRRAACSPSRSKPMTVRASCCSRRCATPTARRMCAPRSKRAPLQLLHLAPVSTRKEKGDWVPGLVAVASAPPSSSARV